MRERRGLSVAGPDWEGEAQYHGIVASYKLRETPPNPCMGKHHAPWLLPSLSPSSRTSFQVTVQTSRRGP